MQEYGRELVAPLINGVQPDDRMQRDSPHLIQSKNAKPSPFGAISPEKLTDPTASTIATYPFPQLMRGGRWYLKLGQTTLDAGTSAAFATLSSITTYDSGTPASTLAIAAGGPWHAAFFHDMVFLTNGASFIFKLPSNASSKWYNNTTIAVRALCRYKTRLALLGVNLGASWLANTRWLQVLDHWRRTLPGHEYANENFSPDTSWVFWSKYGGDAFDRPFLPMMAMLGVLGNSAFDDMWPVIKADIENRQIGFWPMPDPGIIGSGCALGSDLVVFGANGILRLEPRDYGFEETPEHPYGLYGRGALGGWAREVVFIGSGGYLYKWVLGAGIKNLGFRHIFRLYDATKTIVTYDPVEDEYWISDGTYCYILTSADKLGGPLEIMPSAVVREGTSLYACKKGTATQVLLQYKEISWGSRDFKHFQGMQLEYEGVTGVEAMVEWRNKMADGYVARAYKPANVAGFCPLDMSSVDGRMNIRATIADLTTPNVRIGLAELRFQNEGKQYERGTSGRSGNLS